MLKQHKLFFIQALFIFDLALLCACWVIAYGVRFYMPPVATRFPPSEIPNFDKYLRMLIAIVFIWGFVFRMFSIYKPRRMSRFYVEMMDIVKAATFGFMTLATVNFFLMPREFSRLTLGIFYLLSVSLLVISHYLFRGVLRDARKKGYNQRHVLIVGAGDTARAVATSFHSNREMGYHVAGFLTRTREDAEAHADGIPILGTYEDVRELVLKEDLDEVVIALPAEDQDHLHAIIEKMGDELANLHVVPDYLHAMSLHISAEVFDGIPFITFRASPIFGWGRMWKRAFDIATASLALLVFSVPMIVIAAIVKLTSKGPVFYRQERMGIDGETFDMLKFRSMRTDAEVQTGAVWAVENDPRRTWIGRILRSTSLDELPQFFNVLKGEMSMVGPRPERPVFVEQFRKTVPKYMLRHKIKAGITGWAQVNGWRGDTSIEERIRHDIYYIENWSLWFDLRILILTFFRAFKNAY